MLRILESLMMLTALGGSVLVLPRIMFHPRPAAPSCEACQHLPEGYRIGHECPHCNR